MHEDKIAGRYRIEMWGALFLYAVVQASSIKTGDQMPEGLWRTLVLCSPILPFLLMIGVLVRHFRQVDEYVRIKMLQNFAITAALTAGWTFAYGLLENAGFPQLSMWTVCPAMGTILAVVSSVRCLAAR